jgi:hydroxypyruvate reductase/glycerate 2-kinase
MMMSKRATAQQIWQVAVDSVRPRHLIPRFFQSHPEILTQLQNAPRILVVGCGKASAEMTHSLEEVLADLLARCEGIVNVPNEQAFGSRRIRLHGARPAASNFPTAEGVAGAQQMLHLLSHATPDDVAIRLTPGGGSALLPCPIEGITLEDKLTVTKLLHHSGANITEMNIVRKHLSAVKGGRLAQAFTGKKMIGLILSDVIDDPLDVIASGPTTPDPSTYSEAVSILHHYHLWERIPPPVQSIFQKGIRGELPETPKQLDHRIENFIIGNNALALETAANEAQRLNYPQVIRLPSNEQGDTQTCAREFAQKLRGYRNRFTEPVCVLSGGETTVNLGTASGRGGRNQEYALTLLTQFSEQEWEQITFLSAGTDGEDGPTPAAGAFADREMIHQMQRHQLNADDYLSRHDSYTFFEKTNGLFITGLTGTNVMDIRVTLLEPTQRMA